MPSPQVISREVGQQSKGPRLQRLRCLKKVLERVAALGSNAHVFCSVEHEDDVFVCDGVPALGSDRTTIEQDKNFDAEGNFTCQSADIRNTLVGFIDLWFKYIFSPNVSFCFYTPSGIGKEKETEASKKLGIKYPDMPLLAALRDRKFDEPGVLQCVKAIVLDEYRQQYAKREDKGNLPALEKWDDGAWRTFLSRVEWLFGQEDDEAVEAALVAEVKKSPFYNARCIDREKQIISLLLDRFDARQGHADLTMKLVHAAQINVVFREAEANSSESVLEDPMWEMWGALTPSDKRNLRDKVVGACGTIDEEVFGRWCRKLAANK